MDKKGRAPVFSSQNVNIHIFLIFLESKKRKVSKGPFLFLFLGNSPLTGCCPNLILVAMPGWPRTSFLGSRSNFIVLVRGKMFGITPDRHTWMLELSYGPFVNGSSMYAEFCAVAGPLRHYQ